MKSLRPLSLAVVMIGFAVTALPSPVRADHVRIANQTSQKVKVCVYNGTDKRMVVALKCWTLNAKKDALWDRGKDNSAFNVKVFRPGVIDKLWFSKANVSNAARLNITNKGVIPAAPKPSPQAAPTPIAPTPTAPTPSAPAPRPPSAAPLTPTGYEALAVADLTKNQTVTEYMASTRITVTFDNKLGEKIKVCAYDVGDLLFKWIAQKCLTINANDIGTWDRGNRRSAYAVRVFRPAPFDTILCAKELPFPYPVTPDADNIRIESVSGDKCTITSRMPLLPPTKILDPPEEPRDLIRAAVAMMAAAEVRDTSKLTIKNFSPEKIQVCAYNKSDKVMLVALKCWEINAKDEAKWDRGEGTRSDVRFKVTTLRPIFTKQDTCLKTEVSNAVRLEIHTVTPRCKVIAQLPVPPARLRSYGVTAQKPSGYRGWLKAHSQQITYYVAAGANHLFVGFAGSANKENYEMNMDSAPDELIDDVWVHHGWWYATGNAYPNIKQAIAEMRGSRELVITGHSMGAALAGYLAYRLLHDDKPTYPIALVTFAAPRYAGKGFAEHFQALRDKHPNVTAYSVENRGDEVLQAWPRGERVGEFIDYDNALIDNKPPDNRCSDRHSHATYHKIATRPRPAPAAASGNKD